MLVVDDFGIKYVKEDDLNHLITTLEEHYQVKVDKKGWEFVKIELDWEYDKGRVHLLMAPYLNKALCQKQDSPYPNVEPKYGAKQQYADYDESPPASNEDQKYMQISLVLMGAVLTQLC